MAFRKLRRVMLLAALVAVAMVLVAAGMAYGLAAATDLPDRPSFSRWLQAGSPR